MDYGVFNVHTDVNACDCTRGCTKPVGESALKVDWKKNPLPHQGIEPVSAVCRSDALATELHLHHHPKFCKTKKKFLNLHLWFFCFYVRHFAGLNSRKKTSEQFCSLSRLVTVCLFLYSPHYSHMNLFSMYLQQSSCLSVPWMRYCAASHTRVQIGWCYFLSLAVF